MAPPGVRDVAIATIQASSVNPLHVLVILSNHYNFNAALTNLGVLPVPCPPFSPALLPVTVYFPFTPAFAPHVPAFLDSAVKLPEDFIYDVSGSEVAS